MNFLFQNRPIQDKIAIGKICFDILSQKISSKPASNNFCGIWIDGRDRNIGCIEDLASIKSFYLYSRYNYPLIIFAKNYPSELLSNTDFVNLPIKFIQIKEINSHNGYSDFCTKELPHLIPQNHEKLLFLQCDAFVIKNGWEDYLNFIKVDYIGSSWQHTPFIEFFVNNQWCICDKLKPSFVGNGGVSFRTLKNLKYISDNYSSLKMREFGTIDKSPPEDLFYSYLTQLNGKLATKEQANIFSKDPLKLSDYLNKTCYMGHFPIYD